MGLALEGLLVACVSLLCAVWVLRLWRADLAVPLRYAPVDDTKFYLMLVKGIAEHGSYLSNSSLGAPFGQQLSDYPQGADNLNLLVVRGLSIFSANPAVVVNLFFLLSFALASFTSHVVLRSLGAGARAAGVASILFALLPYHFFRGESHLLLSAYYAIPLSAYLFLELLAATPLFTRRARSRHRWTAWLSRRSLLTLALCVLVGSENLYYATFAVVMLLAGTIVALIGGRRRAAISGLVITVAVSASVALNLSPSLIYRVEHGSNATLERSAAFTESSGEAFSLRLANLILPAPDSHIKVLSDLATSYDHTIAPGYCEACYASLGSVGTIGFLWLVLVALAALLGTASLLGAHSRLRHAGVGVAVAFAVGTVGGIASLIEVFITPDIRAWNRISIFIAFLCLFAVSVLLERLLARLGPMRWGRTLASSSLVAILVFGVYEQSSDSFIPSYSATARQWRSDEHFVGAIQQRLPRGASVFQLPYVPFPEGYPETPVGDQLATYATKYEPLRGYLHSSTLLWSYGAMKGRASDWSAQLDGQPLPYVLAAVSAAGFAGLWVDPGAFEAQKGHRLEAGLQALLEQRPLVSPLGDLWFFDLRPYYARLRRTHAPSQLRLLRERTLHPLSTACSARGLIVSNPSRAQRRVTLTVHLARAGHPIERSLPADGQASDIPASASLLVTEHLQLAPGRRLIGLGGPSSTVGSSPRVLYATLTDDSLVGFARAGNASTSTLVAGLTGPPCSS